MGPAPSVGAVGFSPSVHAILEYVHRILALWATPRSVSTAFERMMIERGDHVVLDEPFSLTYYFSDERRSDRFDDVVSGSGPRAVWRRILAAASERPVFVKDMAYQAVHYLDAEALATIEHSFLVRDPRLALPSLAGRWPDFSRDEAGYERQCELFELVRAVTGRTPVVVEADGLRRSPERVVRAWCEAVGIPFVEAALSWSPGMQPQWRRWRDWYEGVAQSTGFRPPDKVEPPPIGDQRVAETIDRSRPCYETLAGYALSPKPGDGTGRG